MSCSTPLHSVPVVLALMLALPSCRAPIPEVLQSPEYGVMQDTWDTAMSPERRGDALATDAAFVAAAEGVELEEEVPLPQLISDETPYALQLRGAALSQAFMLIAEMGSLNLMLDGDFSSTVQLNLPAVPLQNALEMLVDTYGCSLEVAAGDIAVLHRQSPGDELSRVFVLRSVNAADLEPQLVAMLGNEAIVVNTQRNVLLVTGDSPTLERVEKYLAAVDQPGQQVLIEVRILEISRSDLLELGAAVTENSINFNDWTASFVTDLLSPSPKVIANAGSANGSIDITLDALQTMIDLQILQRPRLMALHGHQAKLEIIQEVPYIQSTASTQSGAGTIGTQTVEEVEFKDIGLELSILPNIQHDGLVALTLDQQVSVQSGTFNDIPIVQSRNIQTSFVIEEGETIMIGGIMEDSSQERIEGVPLLKDIPLLGHFFTNTHDELRSTELVILITPRLVDPWSTAETAPSARLILDPEGIQNNGSRNYQDRASR